VPDPVTPAEAIEQKLVELDKERARLKGELARVDGERELYERALGVLRGDLTAGKESVNLRSKMPAMQPVSRLIRSKAVASDRLADAVNAAGMTMSDLANELKVTPSYLSQLRHGKKPITQDRADEIEKLTGFKANKRNWPRLALPRSTD